MIFLHLKNPIFPDGILLLNLECDKMKQPETIEEELEIIAAAIDAGIDPFPPIKEPKPWGKIALGWFMIIMMLSWVSKLLNISLDF